MDDYQRQQRLDQACEALERGAHARALAILDQLVAVDEDSPAVCHLRAHALLRMGNHAEALAEAERGAQLAPRDVYSHRVLCWAAWQAGRLGVAQAALERAIDLSGGSPAALAEYAEFMACARGPRLGEEAARAAIAADGKSATAWAALGIAQYRMHRPKEAEESLKQALALDSDNPRAQWGMVLLLQDKGEHAQADALASFLEHNAGAEQFVADVHREAQRRKRRKTAEEE